MVQGARRRRGARRRQIRIFGWILRVVVGFVAISLLWVLLYRFVPPPVTFTQVGDLLGGKSIHRDWMSLDEIDRNMVRAAIAAEDSKFCTHHGFDQDAIAAAMRRNARGGSVIRGGSTISQQTAKNAFLWQGGGYLRKGIEAWFTFLIENLWGKRRIMEVYLNVAETGIGTYGVNAGAQRYFGHDASTMSRSEASRIAAVLPLPKKRGAVAPTGFTRRYGNSVSSRVGIVARDGLDACIYQGARAMIPSDISKPKKPKAEKVPVLKKSPEPEPAFVPEVPGSDYETPAGDAPPMEPPSAASEPAPAEEGPAPQ